MGMGGADQQLLSLAQTLRARGWNARIVSLTALGPMGRQAQELGIPTESLEIPRGVPDPRGIMRLRSIIRSWKPEILHSHLLHANLLARLLRPLARVPILVSTIHSINYGGRLRLIGYRLTDSLADCTTIVSQIAAERYIAAGAVLPERLRVIPNGVDTQQFRPLPQARAELRRVLGLDHAFAWLAVGRFDPPKDYPNMLAAFAKVSQRLSNSVLLLVGRGSLQPQTEELARSLGVGDRVRFLGVRRDVAELMSAADAYVLSSAWEGMPMVLLEAAASGLPIVATSVGGNPEVVVDEETGFLVPPRDPAALAVGMLRLAALPPDQRRRLGQHGREHIETNYSLPRIADVWEELYHELLERKGISPRAVGRSQGDVAGAITRGGQR
jgi:glycosyltransferase involved in cell wall biosynthesis